MGVAEGVLLKPPQLELTAWDERTGKPTTYRFISGTAGDAHVLAVPGSLGYSNEFAPPTVVQLKVTGGGWSPGQGSVPRHLPCGADEPAGKPTLMGSHMRPSSAWLADKAAYVKGRRDDRGSAVAVGIAVPAATAAWLGAFDIPRNDSWSYRRVLWEFVGTGHVRLVGWSGMTMVGQVFWTAPFVEVLGKGQWVPGAAVAVASAIGLICAYSLARSLVPRAWQPGACC